VGTFASPGRVPQKVHDGRSNEFFKALNAFLFTLTTSPFFFSCILVNGLKTFKVYFNVSSEAFLYCILPSITGPLPPSPDPWVLLENSIIKGMLKVRRKKPYLASEEARETLFFNELCRVLKRTP
jgi:hypothetical protein